MPASVVGGGAEPPLPIAITAALEWARIEGLQGSPVEAVQRELPNRAAGAWYNEAVHWSEAGAALGRMDETRCAGFDEVGHPVHGAPPKRRSDTNDEPLGVPSGFG